MRDSTVLVIVRHGETPANLDGVWHGSTDTALTERGHAQAERVAGYLGAEHAGAAALYVSPLQRARHTAEPIARALDLAPTVEPDLREYDLGSWEGKSYRELYRDYKLFEHIRRDPDYAPHGGESPRGVTQRLAGALLRIGAAHAGERVVVVSHGGALSMAFAELVEGHYTRWDRVMDNCAVSELLLGETPAFRHFNRTAHLDGL